MLDLRDGRVQAREEELYAGAGICRIGPLKIAGAEFLPWARGTLAAGFDKLLQEQGDKILPGIDPGRGASGGRRVDRPPDLPRELPKVNLSAPP